MGALNTQVGGGHYKDLAIQPMEYSMANQLDPCQHTAIKYITRFRAKGGVQDLEKAKHCIDLLIEFEKRRQSEEFVAKAAGANEKKPPMMGAPEVKAVPLPPITVGGKDCTCELCCTAREARNRT
jgi:hypothetical protein